MTGAGTVLIAGGGVGGLALGVALRRIGLRAVVIERNAGADATGAGLVLYPNGVKALDALGLGPAVRAAGRTAAPEDVRPVYSPEGLRIGADPVGALGPRFGAPQISLLRSALHLLLLARARDAGVELRFGTPVIDHVDHIRPPDRRARGGVTAVLADGGLLTGDVLVGADGIGSRVRRRLLADGPPLYQGYTTVRGRSPVLGHHHGFVVSGRGLDLFAAPVADDALYWTAKIPAPAGVFPSTGRTGAHTALLRRMIGWHPALAAVVRRADPAGLVVTDIYDRDPAPRWSSGAVALLGDAAHPMSPALGQGAGLAVEDALVLAAHLAAATPADGVPEALQAYAAARMPRTAAAVLLARGRGPSGVRFSSRDQALAELFAWSPPDLPVPVPQGG